MGAAPVLNCCRKLIESSRNTKPPRHLVKRSLQRLLRMSLQELIGRAPDIQCNVITAYLAIFRRGLRSILRQVLPLFERKR